MDDGLSNLSLVICHLKICSYDDGEDSAENGKFFSFGWHSLCLYYILVNDENAVGDPFDDVNDNDVPMGPFAEDMVTTQNEDMEVLVGLKLLTFLHLSPCLAYDNIIAIIARVFQGD